MENYLRWAYQLGRLVQYPFSHQHRRLQFLDQHQLERIHHLLQDDYLDYLEYFHCLVHHHHLILGL